MEESLVFMDGKFVRDSEATVSVRSKAFNYGLGCFEGIRAYWNEQEKQLYIFKMDEHYQRLQQSCKTLCIGLPYSVKELGEITKELLRRNQYHTSVYIRPVAYKGANHISPTLTDDDNRLTIYAIPLGVYASKEVMDVGFVSWTRLADNMLPPRVKATASYLNSALATLEAVQNGYDEALFLTKEGYVAEGPGENLFLVRGGKLITPSVSECLLEGITRKVVIELAKNELGMEVEERRVNRTELYVADEVFFSGTAMEVTPIGSVDRRVVGDGKPGKVCRQLKELFASLTRGQNPKYREWCTPVY